MQTKKSLIVFILLFALFNVLAFVIPAERWEAFWIAYAFMIAAFVLLFYVWHKGFNSADTLTSKFLHIPSLSVAVIYLIIQAVVFGIAMGIPVIPVWLITVVCAALFVLFYIFIVASKSGARIIENVDAKIAANTDFIKTLTFKAKTLADNENDPQTRNELTGLYEQIRFSDPVSSPALSEIEHKITEKFKELEASPNKQKYITELERLISERNELCRTNK